MEMVVPHTDHDTRMYHSNISISRPDTPKSVPQNALRRASAALSKLLPQPVDLPKDHKNESHADDGLSKMLSAMYCKALVLLGLVLPLSEVLVDAVHPGVYQAYYIFLCSGSLIYLTWMYATLVRDRTVVSIINNYKGDEEAYNVVKSRFRGPINRYGSFYLRLGAVGSMVYSGLEFGQVLEVEDYPECQNLTQAITPAFRMILTIAQMQFIFLNSQNMDLCSRPLISRFGLMHMIGTNLCEWLNVIVQETKHEISHLTPKEHHDNETNIDLNSTVVCRRTNIMGSLVQDVSPFLFPCTIEYSLICAVIMLEMWKNVKTPPKNQLVLHKSASRPAVPKPSHLFTVDCANAHKGLFCGVVILVLTIICLIVHFVFSEQPGYEAAANQTLYILSLLAVILAARKLHGSVIVHRRPAMCLDTWLLIMGQTGVSFYSAFRLVGLLVTGGNVINESARLIQSSAQTIFVVHAWRLRSKNPRKPARQLITFLLAANMAVWSVNTLVRNKATYDKSLIVLFGPWAWTTVTRLAMPLAIFYRFHSTICLFEIWKNTYKTVAKPFLLRHNLS